METDEGPKGEKIKIMSLQESPFFVISVNFCTVIEMPPSLPFKGKKYQFPQRDLEEERARGKACQKKMPAEEGLSEQDHLFGSASAGNMSAQLTISPHTLTIGDRGSHWQLPMQAPAPEKAAPVTCSSQK